jgi:hypothetical protein
MRLVFAILCFLSLPAFGQTVQAHLKIFKQTWQDPSQAWHGGYVSTEVCTRTSTFEYGSEESYAWLMCDSSLEDQSVRVHGYVEVYPVEESTQDVKLKNIYSRLYVSSATAHGESFLDYSTQVGLVTNVESRYQSFKLWPEYNYMCWLNPDLEVVCSHEKEEFFSVEVTLRQ